ncbi:MULTISPECIES: lysozyme inhibitor LprI family protein [Pseudanabaena]|uniref:lysozyme inhibitor LprI family protein n=1 Tax=Pseudanabaena TaxID=1152 RepID=UPI0024799045|nr:MULTISPECIES: lysozyme inhibitor LprI family protein [Pseudanabaena]MEA5489447.1 lysozyme inhibitor LprI family protein [Pseudanabaena sp. CCNP1317]WGS73334.1 lysozyme inhibitor LprI family protein [Pseudanabaena galeata CCNP1313]
MNFTNKNKFLLISLGFMLTCFTQLVSPLSAQDDTSCVKPRYQVQMQRCARLAYEKADRELNSVWKEVISQLSGNEKERLIDRQLAWIDERDATCDRETQNNMRGSGYRIFLNDCLRRVTIERTEVLRGYLR